MSNPAPANGFRTFLALWVSQSFSVFGSALTMFAMNIWLVQVVYPRPDQQPELAWALAAIGLTYGLTSLVTMPFAGAFADRLDRKRLMFWTDVFSGVLMAALAGLMATGALQLWTLLGLLAVLVLLSTLHGSAFDASYAMLVPERHLARANGMMQSMWALSGIISPGIAAFLIALPVLARQGMLPGSLATLLAPLPNGTALAIMIDAATFFMAAAVLPLLHVPSPVRTDLGGVQGRSLAQDIRLGAVYVWRRRPLVWLLGTYAVFNLLLPLGVFLPLIVKQGLGADWAARGYSYETALAFLTTMGAVGGVAGGAVISLWGGFRTRRVMVVLVTVFVGAALQIALGLSSSLYVAAGVLLLMEFGFPVGNAHSQAVWQSQVPRELQGRVFAVRRVIASSMAPLGQVLAGWLAGAMAPGLGLALLGSITCVVCAVQMFNPVLMRAEDRDYLERMASAAEGSG